MADSTFNPYRQWLGIQDHELPANCYRLLGLAPFEQDAARIAAAADQMIAHVRAIAPGERVAEWQRLIGELGAARHCLTDPGQKARYDAQLYQQFQGGSGPSQPAALASHPAQPVPGGAYPQARPIYQQGGPPVALPVGAPPMRGNPMAPVARPVAAAAPGAAIPDLGISGGGSSRVSARLRKKSNAPLVVALCALAGFGALMLILVLNRDAWISPAKPPVVAQTSPRQSATPVETAPASTKPVPAKPKPTPAEPEPMPSSGGIPVPGLDYNRDPMPDTPEQPDAPPEMKAPPAMSKEPAEMAAENPAPATAPEMPKPEMTEPEMTVPKMTPPETPVATPTPQPEPPAAEPAAPRQPTPEQAAAFDKALRAAYDALAERDVAAAKRELAAAEPLAINDEQQSRLRGMQLVLQGVESFWNAAREGLKGLIGTSDDLELESGTRVAVVEASPDFLILHAAGQNRRYEFDTLPSGLAMLLAKRWFDAGAPSTKVFLGAFQFVDPRGDKEDVRRLWEAAGREGVATDDLLPLLDMKK